MLSFRVTSTHVSPFRRSAICSVPFRARFRLPYDILIGAGVNTFSFLRGIIHAEPKYFRCVRHGYCHAIGVPKFFPRDSPYTSTQLCAAVARRKNSPPCPYSGLKYIAAQSCTLIDPLCEPFFNGLGLCLGLAFARSKGSRNHDDRGRLWHLLHVAQALRYVSGPSPPARGALVSNYNAHLIFLYKKGANSQDTNLPL